MLPTRESLPPPPIRLSPAPTATRVSLPRPPERVLAASLPTIESFPSPAKAFSIVLPVAMLRV
ncbi:hypothetical protein C7B69_04520 [filamentous cyanobacterium Phorm 46]|nr:hypothetical protein C7B69_04520 [filamentous cyanobacterium Phorm 46]